MKNLDKPGAADYACNKGPGDDEEVAESVIEEFDMLVAGFPCKDVSDYNAFREKHRNMFA